MSRQQCDYFESHCTQGSSFNRIIEGNNVVVALGGLLGHADHGLFVRRRRQVAALFAAAATNQLFVRRRQREFADRAYRQRVLLLSVRRQLPLLGPYVLDLLADDHVDDAAPPQVQHVPDADHDGRADAQRPDHPHVAEVGEHGVVERPEREHRYDRAQREQEHGHQEIRIRDAVARAARPAHVLG